MNLSLLTRGLFSAFSGTTEESITDLEVVESLTGFMENVTELMGTIEYETEIGAMDLQGFLEPETELTAVMEEVT